RTVKFDRPAHGRARTVDAQIIEANRLAVFLQRISHASWAPRGLNPTGQKIVNLHGREIGFDVHAIFAYIIADPTHHFDWNGARDSGSKLHARPTTSCVIKCGLHVQFGVGVTLLFAQVDDSGCAVDLDVALDLKSVTRRHRFERRRFDLLAKQHLI